MSLSSAPDNQDDNVEVNTEVAAASAPMISSPAHRYVRYEYHKIDGVWYPPRDANIGEILHGVVVAGRSSRLDQPLFDMKKQTPFAYSVYNRIEQKYQQRTGRRAHIFHSLTTDDYMKILDELCIVIENDPCNREWMVY